jgi:hypothetical protein
MAIRDDVSSASRVVLDSPVGHLLHTKHLFGCDEHEVADNQGTHCRCNQQYNQIHLHVVILINHPSQRTYRSHKSAEEDDESPELERAFTEESFAIGIADRHDLNLHQVLGQTDFTRAAGDVLCPRYNPGFEALFMHKAASAVASAGKDEGVGGGFSFIANPAVIFRGEGGLFRFRLDDVALDSEVDSVFSHLRQGDTWQVRSGVGLEHYETCRRAGG